MIDEPTIKRMLDCIYEDKLFIGYSNAYDEPCEDYELNVAPIFAEMVDNAHLADGYQRILESDHRDVWLFSWSEYHKASFVGAKALACVLQEWTSMRWMELAERISSGELNDMLTEFGYEFLCMTPLPIDDIEHVSWI